MATKSGRTIAYQRERSAKTLLIRWETLLILLFLAVNIMNASISPNYLDAFNLFTNISSFLVKGFIALPMAYVLLLGDIDLSVGSIVCLSATLLGVTYNSTGSIILAILVCVLVGIACGAFNGFVLTRFTELAPMIVTLATMTLYRGFAEAIVGDTSTSGMSNVEWIWQTIRRPSRTGSLYVPFVLRPGGGVWAGHAQDDIWTANVRCGSQQFGIQICWCARPEGSFYCLYADGIDLLGGGHFLLRLDGVGKK